VTSTSRGRVIAIAAFLAASPALAACGAGFDANTNAPYSPTDAGVLIQDSASGKSYGKNGVMISQAFILGPNSGEQIAAGGSAPLYLAMLSESGNDSLTAITPDAAMASSVKTAGPVQLTPDALAKTPNVLVEGLKKPLRGGESVRLTLKFQNAGDITLTVPVVTRSREFATLPPAPGTPIPAPTPSAAPSASASPAH
jgi:hypothetical protein